MIVDRIYTLAATFPDKVAVIHNGQSLDYASFARAIDATREFIEARRLPSRGIAVVTASNQLDTWLRALALRQLGLDTVAVSAWRHFHTLRINRPACIVPATARQAAWFRATTLLSGTHVFSVPKDLYSQLERRAVPEPEGRARFGDQFFSSSGTTGTHKLIAYEGSRQHEVNLAKISSLNIHSETVFNVQSLHMWTGIGGMVPAAVWDRGGTVVFDRGPNTIGNIFDHGTNAAFVLSGMTADCARQLEAVARNRSPDMRHVTLYTGGGLLSAKHSRIFRSLKNCTTVLGFGSTELSGWPLATRLTDEDDAAGHWLEPASDRMIEIVDENDRLCQSGTEGRLRIKLKEHDSHGYVNDPEATRRCFRNGYFYTGDYAIRRADGRIKILGRVADVLIVNSQKVALAPIEAEIRSLLGIDEVCVYSGLAADGTEEFVVAIESSTPPAISAMQQIARKFSMLEGARWEALPSFPRTDSGMNKVKREVLRSMLFAEARL